MEQSGKDWLLWRKDGITSTDAPVIMNVSPYKSKFQLFKEKTSPSVEEQEKYIFKMGHKIEKQVRALYEIKEQIDFRPMLMERIDFPFLKASMDGANIEHKRGIEIKLVSKKEFDLGECPERYFPQIQHQYMVSGFYRIDLILAVKLTGIKVDYKVVSVPPDLEYINRMVVAEFKFYFQNILANNPPEITDIDFIKAPKKLVEYAKKISKLNDRYKKIHNELRGISGQLRELDAIVTNEFPANGYKSGKMKIRVYEDGVYVY